jgi:hypothetical protein
MLGCWIAAFIVAAVVGGIVGYFSVNPMLNLITRLSTVRNGPWGTTLATGSASANPYLRAWIARHALLALRKEETIYFSAYTDDDGKPLRGDCNYRIEGRAPDARWWSITAYGEDDFLIPNEQGRYSWGSTEITLDEDERFTIYLSRDPRPGHWLPTGEAKRLCLSLRLYNPGPAYYNRSSLRTVELPRIIRED